MSERTTDHLRDGRTRPIARLVALSVVAAGGLVVAPGPHVAPVVAAATFDYSMPDRYGMDADGDGVVDSFVPTTTCVDEDGPCTEHAATSAFDVRPPRWRVDLDACASTDAGEFDWTVLWRPTVTVQQSPGGGCDDFFAEFPAEGTYQVGLRTRADADSPWGERVWQDVVVQDWLVVSIGDSYGAGEGSPDVPVRESVLTDAAEAFTDLGAALADLADLGPCNAGTGFDYDLCVSRLAADGDAAIDHAVELIQRLDDPVCAVATFDLVACGALLVELGVTVAAEGIDAVLVAVDATYDSYVARFQAVFDAAAATVAGLEAVIEEFRREARWQDRRCHRSANAGASLAALELEDLDPRTSVTLIHVACTGAMILEGVLGSYGGAEDEVESLAADPIPPQIHQVAQLIGDREIDVVNISIGGNDVNFGAMIMSCILSPDCSQRGEIDDVREAAESAANTNCGQSFPGVVFVVQPIVSTLCSEFFAGLADNEYLVKDAQTLFDLGRFGDPEDPLRPGIEVAYQMLDDALHRPPFPGSEPPTALDEPGLGLPVDRSDRVYITEYVNPLLDESGAVCSADQHGLEMLPGVSAVESEWLDATIVPQLTDVVAEGATAHGWTFVTGIVEGFEARFGSGHGYCALPDGAAAPTAFADPLDGSWLVQLQDAFLRQGNKMGAVHPNPSGFRHYAQQILPVWLDDLYGDPTTLASPRRPDQLPFADAGPTRLLDEGDTVVLTNRSYDGDLDPLAFSWSTTTTSASVAPADGSAPTLTAIDDGAGHIALTVDDGDDGTSSDAAVVVVRNVPPTVADAIATVGEGSELSTSVAYLDPGVLDTHVAAVDPGDGTTATGSAVSGGSVPVTHTYADDGSYHMTVTVTDDDGGTGTGELAVTVVNAPPAVGAIVAPIEPVLIGTTIDLSATFTDAGIDDTHTASIDWGDGTTTMPANLSQGVGAGDVSGAHAYAAPGIYSLTVSVTDDDGGVGTAQHQYVVVYDPDGGFATGGGTLASPAGAYLADPAATGPAVFAFVSKYARGATVPTGSTSFRFHAADFVFASTSYQWLVISGTRATYKGLGTVDGQGQYGFLLSAVDGGEGAATEPDRLRLKVFDPDTGDIVYDNQLGASDDAAPDTAITAGAISVKGPKGSRP